MQQYAHLLWLFGDAALPLTLLPQSTWATTANAGCIDHTATCETNPTLDNSSGMGRDNDATPFACFAQALVRTVVERTFFRQAVCLHVALDSGHGPLQFCSVLSFAGVSKTGEPLMRMGL
jgi:hypothetical protein